jgi:ligand-binding sensor domain-containing protein/serine phosphatase RsbU (regulator of sigma subunit)
MEAQDLHFKYYRAEDGLNTELTKSVIQDSQGYVWITTDGGITRFDGKHIYLITKLNSNFAKSFLMTGDSLLAITDEEFVYLESKTDTIIVHQLLSGSSISDSTVYYPKTLYKDNQGQIWLSEPNSISKYLGKGKVKRYMFPPECQTNSFIRSFSIIEDGNGKIWAISQKGHVFIYQPDLDRFERMLDVGIEVSTIIEASKGVIWLGTPRGIFEVSINQVGKVQIEHKKISLDDISCIKKIKEGVFLVGTWLNGLYWLVNQDNKLVLEKEINFKLPTINDIYVHPKNDDIWISSDKGIVLGRMNLFSRLSQGHEGSFFIQDIIQANDSIFYATNGSRIFEISINQYFKGYQQKVVHTLPNATALTLGYFNNTLYVGTSTGEILKFNDLTEYEKFYVPERETIFHIELDDNGNVWSCPNIVGLFRMDKNGRFTNYQKDKGIFDKTFVIKKSPKGEIYVGGQGIKNYLYLYDSLEDKFLNISVSIDSIQEIFVNDLAFVKEGMYLATSKGLFLYQKKTLQKINLPIEYEIRALIFDQKNQLLWIGTQKGLLKYHLQSQNLSIFKESSGLGSKIIQFRGLALDSQNRIWVATTDGISFNQSQNSYFLNTEKPLIFSLKVNEQNILPEIKKLKIPYKSKLEMSYICLRFPAENVFYQSRVIGIDSAWSPPTHQTTLFLPQLSWGKYTIQIQAIGNQELGAEKWSEPIEFTFEVQAPWFLSWYMVVVYFAILATFIFLIVKINTVRLRKEKERLESLVEKRTALVNQQKEELTSTLQVVSQQKSLIEKKNEDITASINYARRIQLAMLPFQETIEKYTGKDNFFILYKPRDIVSGDFYFFEETENHLIFSVADCTGHGVPGAFMSMIGNQILSEIILKEKIIEPQLILKALNVEIQRTLKQNESERWDGMDICLLIIQKDFQKAFYAGAMNPLYYIQNQSFCEIKADKHPIGGFHYNPDRTFKKHEIAIESETIFYLCSDGYQDQFGGEKCRKFMVRNLRKYLFEISHQTMNEQKNLLDVNFENWRKVSQQEQIDDVSIMGLKVINKSL